jgi:hypothetical protein
MQLENLKSFLGGYENLSEMLIEFREIRKSKEKTEIEKEFLQKQLD